MDVVEAFSPSAPVNVTAGAGDGNAAVSWAPVSDGGSPITTYTITCLPRCGSAVTVYGTIYSTTVWE